MKVSLNWLKKFIDLEGIEPEVIANKLTFAGVEVESVEKLVKASNLVIGKILTCVAHPDSDHLHVTKVNIGNEVYMDDSVSICQEKIYLNPIFFSEKIFAYF